MHSKFKCTTLNSFNFIGMRQPKKENADTRQMGKRKIYGNLQKQPVTNR